MPIPRQDRHRYEIDSYEELINWGEQWVKKYGTRGTDYNGLRFGQWLINNTTLQDVEGIFYPDHVWIVVKLCWEKHFRNLVK